MPDGKQNTLPARRGLDTNLWRERLRTMFALVLREMAVLYGKNPGGYIWAIIEPLGAIVILSVAFSLVLRSPSLGTSFLLFYATGMLPFLMFQTIARVIGNALGFSKALLQYPSVLWLDAIFARLFLHVLTGVTVTAVVLTGIMIFVESSQQLHLEYLFVSMVGMVLLGFGMGLINAVLFGLLPVWRSIWGIVTRPLLLASGVLYIYEDLPRAAQDVIYYNPLIHLTTLFRQGIYPTYSPQFVSPAYVFGISIAFTAFGLVLLRRYHLRVLEAR